MATYPDLSGQHIFITGAARGLGKSMAEKLAGCGATVAVTDVDANGCDEVAKGICATGCAALAYPVDVAVREQFMQAAAQFARHCGRIDAVVNNAMLLRYEPVEKITPEMLNRMTAIGINGSIWGAQALLAHYDAVRGGATHLVVGRPITAAADPAAAYGRIVGAL